MDLKIFKEIKNNREINKRIKTINKSSQEFDKQLDADYNFELFRLKMAVNDKKMVRFDNLTSLLIPTLLGVNFALFAIKGLEINEPFFMVLGGVGIIASAILGKFEYKALNVIQNTDNANKKIEKQLEILEKWDDIIFDNSI